MNRRRMSVALVAATTTLLAVVTPAQAQEPDTAPAPAQVQNEEDNQSGDDGSSFMGPGDLLRSILSGNGSSGVPEDPENEDATEEDEPALPEWAGSLAVPEELELPLAILSALVAIGATATQIAAIVLPIIPGGVDMLRDLVTSLGIEVPSNA